MWNDKRYKQTKERCQNDISKGYKTASYFMDEYKKNVKQKILEIFPKGELFLKLDKKARNEEIRSRMTTVGLQAIELMILRNKSSLVFAPKTLKAQYLRLNN